MIRQSSTTASTEQFEMVTPISLPWALWNEEAECVISSPKEFSVLIINIHLFSEALFEVLLNHV